MNLNNWKKKKHCNIHVIMKNKKILLIQTFFEHNAFGASLLFSFIYFLDFLILVQ